MFEERRYLQVANVPFERGGPLGRASLAPCAASDSDASRDPGRPVYEVLGLDHDLGIAAEAAGQMTLFGLHQEGSFSTEVVNFVEAARAGARPSETPAT